MSVTGVDILISPRAFRGDIGYIKTRRLKLCSAGFKQFGSLGSVR